MKSLLTTCISLAMAMTMPTIGTAMPQPDLETDEQQINLSDGVFREYRLAVFFTRQEFESPRFNKDRAKVRAHLKELEDYLNSIYVRDAGVKFTMVYDDRLIDESVNSENVYINNITQVINDHIGSEAYDVGVGCLYSGDPDDYGLAGLATLSGLPYDVWKANVTSMKQEDRTIAHELAHLFGCEHPWVTGSEPGKSGQSIAGYGFSSKTHFLSLGSLKQLMPTVQWADKRIDDSLRFVSATNTPPRIDRNLMKREYVVPKNTFFTIRVYATDNEQTQLNYSHAQWDFLPYREAHFPAFPSSHNPVLNFGRTYSTANNSKVINSDVLPVGEYQMLISVSDALPTDQAIALRQAPLRDNFLTTIKVVEATPFKITSDMASEYKTGQRIKLTWDVDHTFFDTDSKVRITLSDDGGETFNHVLVPSTANDGECEVIFPQTTIGRKTTYEYEGTPIFTMGKAVLRLEVIGQGFYDITDNNRSQGGAEITQSDIALHGTPDSAYVYIKLNDPMPPMPNITATLNGTSIPVDYSETVEDNITRRLWVAQANGTETCYAQYIERESDPVGITLPEAEADKADGTAYDLTGKPISNPQKGTIYIKQGHKIIHR